MADLAEDASDGLWMSGPTRLAKHGFITYTVPDGLHSNQISSLFEDRESRSFGGNCVNVNNVGF